MKEVVLTPMEQSAFNAANFAANLLLAAAVDKQIHALRAEELDLSDASGGAPPLNMVISLNMNWSDLAQAAVGDA
jgi:hypothetical protein